MHHCREHYWEDYRNFKPVKATKLNFFRRVVPDLLHQELFRSQHEVAKFIELTFSPNAFVFDNNDPS